MNTGTIILSVVFIIICASPFIISTRSSRKKNKNMLKALQALAQKHNAQVSDHEVGSDFIIGLDDTKNMVFFYKKTKDETIETSLNLSDYKDCRILKFGKNMNAKSSAHAIDTLKLEFIPKHNSTTEKQLEFFNVDTNIQLSGELEIINTWHPLIKQKIAGL